MIFIKNKNNIFLKNNHSLLGMRDPKGACFKPDEDVLKGKPKTIGEFKTPAITMYRKIAKRYRDKGIPIIDVSLSQLRKDSFNVIRQSLKKENQVIGVLLFDDSSEEQYHASPILIYQGKILFPLQNMDLDDFPEVSDEVIFKEFPGICFKSDPQPYHTQGKTFHPQATFEGCDIFAAKILKFFLSNPDCLKSSLIDYKEQLFYPHPQCYQWGQSKSFFLRYYNVFNNKNKEMVNADSIARVDNGLPVEYREKDFDDFQKRKYGKNTLMYFGAKHSDNKDQQIIRRKIIEHKKNSIEFYIGKIFSMNYFNPLHMCFQLMNGSNSMSDIET